MLRPPRSNPRIAWMPRVIAGTDVTLLFGWFACPANSASHSPSTAIPSRVAEETGEFRELRHGLLLEDRPASTGARAIPGQVSLNGVDIPVVTAPGDQGG